MKTVTDLSAAKYELDTALLHLLRLSPSTATAAVHLHYVQTHSAVPHRVGQQATFDIVFGKLIFSCWGTDFAENWRVHRYDLSPTHIVLAVSRQAGAITGQIVLSVTDDRPLSDGTEHRRQDFGHRLAILLKTLFPGTKIIHAVTRRDLFRHHSGCYTRILFYRDGIRGVALGVNTAESQEIIDGMLGAGLHAVAEQTTKTAQPIGKLLLFAPAGRTRSLAERLTCVTFRGIELYEVDAACQRLVGRVNPAEQLALVTGPKRYLWPSPHVTLSDQEQAVIAEILAFTPHEIEVVNDPQSRFLSLRWLGLEFARVRRERAHHPPAVYFGLRFCGEPLQKLTAKTQSKLNEVIEQLRRYRGPQATDHAHPVYRAQSERWLETVIRREIDRLDPQLNPAYVYSQVPAYSREEAGYADLLTLTRDNCLAVVEVKTREDRELPWQGLDYWRRVGIHHQRGDFVRRGYFPGVSFPDSMTPILYLVAPMLRFHETLREMCRWIDPRVPVRIVGVSQRWRKQLHVIFREELGKPKD